MEMDKEMKIWGVVVVRSDIDMGSEIDERP